MTIAPTQSEIQLALRSFLTEVLPATGPDNQPLDIIAAQQNRVPAPRGSSYVVMTPRAFERIETNVDSATDANFTGSIAGTTMTITAVDSRFPSGEIGVGSTIFGAGVAAGTVVSKILTGSGQIGTYTIAPGQTVSSRTLSAGSKTVQQALKATIQLDFHSTDYSAGDLANTVSTLLRDAFAVDQFANQSPNYGVVPLYADDARQIPFLNDSQAVEWRWVVDTLLQCNVIVQVPQQFTDSVGLDLVSVDEAYAP